MRIALTILSLVTLPLQAWALTDIDLYVGKYFMTKAEGGKIIVDRRPGASLAQDRIEIRRFGETFDRFILRAHDEAPYATLSIYRDGKGRLFTYFRDYVTRPAKSEDFDGSGFKDGVTWVAVKSNFDGSYGFTFYPDDRGSRYRVRVTMHEGRIILNASEPGSPAPLKVDYLFQK